jgi:hypothetical protein
MGARSLALLLVFLPGGAIAGDLQGGGRVQSFYAHDDNVFEATDAARRQTAGSLRLLGEVRLAAVELPLDSRAEFSLRGLAESFQDYPSEDRRQGEVGLSWDLASPAARHRLNLEAGYGLRAYPDSSSRGHHRAWGRVIGVVPVGPRGSLIGRLDAWQLDFRRLPGTDQTGADFDLSCEHPWGRRLVLRGGIELGTVRHRSMSLRILGVLPDTSVYGADRRDHYRFVHVGCRMTGRLVVQVQAGIRMQASNSLDGVLHRPEVTWLVSRPLGCRVIGQFYGNLEHTAYTALRYRPVTRTGEIEVGDDDNTVVLRLTRPIGHGWDLDARLGWYRNEALLVGVYYRKQVASLGISRSFGSSSGF